MPPTRRKGKMKEEVRASTSAGTQTMEPSEPAPPKETIVKAPPVDSPTTSPTFQTPGKTPPRRVLRLKCPQCNDYPDGFRSEHELRRHSNRVHRKTRKVWMTIDSSPDKLFLANCKSCQTGKRYNECYNAASHLRRMHFHPHKRGERKMSAAEARRGGKPGDLDPPMEVLKRDWLKEVDEVVGEGDDPSMGAASPEEEAAVERPQPEKADAAAKRLPPQPPQPPQPAAKEGEGKAPPTPTTPSTRSMAIDSIVDKMDAA